MRLRPRQPFGAQRSKGRRVVQHAQLFEAERGRHRAIGYGRRQIVRLVPAHQEGATVGVTRAGHVHNFRHGHGRHAQQAGIAAHRRDGTGLAHAQRRGGRATIQHPAQQNSGVAFAIDERRFKMIRRDHIGQREGCYERIALGRDHEGLFRLPEQGSLRVAFAVLAQAIGFAQDMDADRLAVVSELGEPIGEELTLVLAVQHVLATTPGPVVANLATTHALDEVTARFGVTVTRSRVGEANVTEVMRRIGAVIGGEGNGGVIFPRINFGRDSLVGMGLILHRLVASGQPLSALVDEIPRRVMLKQQLSCPSQQIAEVLRHAQASYPGLPIDTRDGVKVVTPTGWFLLRGSNTEPIMRLIVEADTPEAADALAAAVRAQIAPLL